MPPRHLGRLGAYRPILAALDPESSSIFRPMPAGCRRFLMSYEWVGAAYRPDVAVMCRIAAKLAGLWSGSSPMSVFARRLRSRRQLARCADSCAVGLAVPAAGVVTSSRAGCALMAEGTSSSTTVEGQQLCAGVRRAGLEPMARMSTTVPAVTASACDHRFSCSRRLCPPVQAIEIRNARRRDRPARAAVAGGAGDGPSSPRTSTSRWTAGATLSRGMVG
jgi:hypothetical protein